MRHFFTIKVCASTIMINLFAGIVPFSIMSLDVYLNDSKAIKKAASSGIFIRENGSTKEISAEEWNIQFPGHSPYIGSLI